MDTERGIIWVCFQDMSLFTGPGEINLSRGQEINLDQYGAL